MRTVFVFAFVLGVTGILVYNRPDTAVELSSIDMETMFGGETCVYVQGSGGEGGEGSVGSKYKCCDCEDTRIRACYSLEQVCRDGTAAGVLCPPNPDPITFCDDKTTDWTCSAGDGWDASACEIENPWPCTPLKDTMCTQIIGTHPDFRRCQPNVVIPGGCGKSAKQCSG